MSGVESSTRAALRLRLAVFTAALGCAGCSGTLPDGPVSPSLPGGIALEWTPASCLAVAADDDLDGLEDSCELALAGAFAPELMVSSSACNFAEGRLEGGYAFTVSPGASQGGVLIGYAPSYLYDCGWSGKKCWLRLRGGCNGHVGDSEFIGLSIGFAGETGQWQTDAVFLSAHCFGKSDSDCRWFVGGDLETFSWVDEAFGAPRVWVAEGKNANYRSRERCDDGHWWFDTCARNDVAVRFPVLSNQQNIGEPTLNSGIRRGGSERCFTLGDLGWSGGFGSTRSESVECFAGVASFTGWSTFDPTVHELHDAVGATPYLRYFRLLHEGPTR